MDRPTILCQFVLKIENPDETKQNNPAGKVKDLLTECEVCTGIGLILVAA